MEEDTFIYEVVIRYTEPTYATFIIEAESESDIRDKISKDIELQGFTDLKFISIKEMDKDHNGLPKVTLQ